MKITMLGTGHAIIDEYYNTCYVLSEDNHYFMIDGGGGKTLLTQLKKVNINPLDIHDVFVTHKHLDHIMGIFWYLRILCQTMSFSDFRTDVYIYGNNVVIEAIDTISKQLFTEREYSFIHKNIHLVEVKNGEEREIMNHRIIFFDIESTKEKQFGYTYYYNDLDKITCLGDEPYHECERKYVENSQWLFHEAFCLYSQREIYKPYEKHHSTVKDACELAEQLNVKNILLYHTEDQNYLNRKQLYTKEGALYYKGNIFVPDDLESIEL